MQKSDIFPPDLRKSKKFEVSSLFYSTNSISNLPKDQPEFIPFSNERDSLGRLLSRKEKRITPKQLASPQINRRKTFDCERKSEAKEDKYSKTMGQFFRIVDIESRELQRAKSEHRKKVIVLGKKGHKKIQNNKFYDIEVGEGGLIKLTKKQNPNIKVKRVQSQKVVISPNPEEKDVQKKQKKKEKETKRIKKNLFSPIDLKLAADQPELRQYFKLKKLQIKVFNDYEVGHEKFKNKMENTKMLAHKIKRGLELE